MNQLKLIQFFEDSTRRNKKKMFTLREFCLLSGETPATAAMTLLRAQKKGLVFRVGRVWINQIKPPTLAQIGFASHSPSYVSFESALYHHGIISQSPRGRLTLAIRGRPGTISTPLGTLQCIHLNTALFFGYDSDRMACAEKAMLDLIYTRGKAGLSPLITEEVYWDLLNKKQLKDYAKKFQPWVGKALKSAITKSAPLISNA